MIQKIITAILFLAVLQSCKDDKNKVPTTALDTGTTFIRATLDGDFPTAESLLLKDTENLQLFDSYKTFYKRLSQETKDNYKKAEYNINKVQDENDSTTLINYSNDYMKKPMDIKIVKNSKQWRIDFKYTSAGNLPTN